MPMFLKIIIRAGLIFAAGWVIYFVIGLIKEMRSGVKEGLEEARAELAEESLQAKPVQTDQKNQAPLLERTALALACPFRAIQIDSELEEVSPHLYQLGRLDEAKKEQLKETLMRDFDLPGETEQTTETDAERQMCDVLDKMEDWPDVFRSSTQLHIITACADLGYIRFSDYEEIVASLIEEIAGCGLCSWNDYSRAFLDGEKKSGINGIGGRALLGYWSGRLLKAQESPWRNLAWDEVLHQGKTVH